MILLEERKMETNEKPASAKQRMLVQTLALRNGIKLEKPVEDLNMAEASQLIRCLLQPESRRTEAGIDNVKLGLATKLVYNNWKYNICAVVRDKKLKELFIEDVLATYKIMQEISQRAGEISLG